jgi:microsomal dipeptidase-like Zn-dependent dipeptidase
MSADIEGVHLESPARCVKADVAGIGLQMWGEFDVDDPTCSSVMECPDCRPAMMGFADLHNHQFANLAFGGKAFVGEAFGPIRTALPHCDYLDGDPSNWVHGPGGVRDNLATVLGGTLGHKVGGYPEFDGWPRWNSYTHQSVYEDWLLRAHQGGLKLMVMLAVNNEWLCQQIEITPGRTCGDMEAVDLQIAAAKQMEAYIDNKSGGSGRGWYRIVYSPQEARDAINKGQLAVVLGAEVDNLFNCGVGSSCTEEYVFEELDKYYQLGIRHLFPIHFYDNAFGGSAISNQLIADRIVNPPITRDCKAEGYKYNDGRCNAQGLTALGKFLIRAMISKGMIIDIDHMSALSFNDTLEIAERFNYPVVSGHTGFIDISKGDKLHEGNLKTEQVERIRKLGGMVALISGQGDLDEIKTWRGDGRTVVEHICGNTSQTWVQAYLYAVEKMQGGPVAFGTDFNGLADLPGPRFGPEACPGGTAPSIAGMLSDNLVQYPYVAEATGASMDRSIIGQKTFDISEDGLAHVGMLPDFIADVEQLGLTIQDLTPLFSSAEGYIQVWERAESNMVPEDSPCTTIHTQTGQKEDEIEALMEARFVCSQQIFLPQIGQ